jgi:hypothetical protein
MDSQSNSCRTSSLNRSKTVLFLLRAENAIDLAPGSATRKLQFSITFGSGACATTAGTREAENRLISRAPSETVARNLTKTGSSPPTVIT